MTRTGNDLDHIWWPCLEPLPQQCIDLNQLHNTTFQHVTYEHKNTFNVVRFCSCKSATDKMSSFFHLYVTLDCSMERNNSQQIIFEVKRKKY